MNWKGVRKETNGVAHFKNPSEFRIWGLLFTYIGVQWFLSFTNAICKKSYLLRVPTSSLWVLTNIKLFNRAMQPRNSHFSFMICGESRRGRSILSGRTPAASCAPEPTRDSRPAAGDFNARAEAQRRLSKTWLWGSEMLSARYRKDSIALTRSKYCITLSDLHSDGSKEQQKSLCSQSDRPPMLQPPAPRPRPLALKTLQVNWISFFFPTCNNTQHHNRHSVDRVAYVRC